MQWAAMWGQMAKDVEKEMEEAKGEEVKMGGFKEEDVEISRLDKIEKRSVIIALLREVRRELSLAQNLVGEMVDVLMSEKSDKEVEQILNTKITAKGMIKDLDRDGLMSGEWVNVTLSKLNTATDKTNLTGVNTLLKMFLYKIVPYNIAYPMPTHMVGGDGGEVEMWEEWEEVTGKATSSAQDAPKFEGKSFSKYKVKSSINVKGMREWKCPVGCGQVFGSSRKCAAHMNKHIGQVYECLTCKYETYNLNSYKKHKCFSGPKTHGEKRKTTAMKRKSGRPVQGESAKKKVPSAASGAPEGTVMKESGAGKEFGAVVKVEKEDDDDDIIVIE